MNDLCEGSISSQLDSVAYLQRYSASCDNLVYEYVPSQIDGQKVIK